MIPHPVTLRAADGIVDCLEKDYRRFSKRRGGGGERKLQHPALGKKAQVFTSRRL